MAFAKDCLRKHFRAINENPADRAVTARPVLAAARNDTRNSQSSIRFRNVAPDRPMMRPVWFSVRAAGVAPSAGQFGPGGIAIGPVPVGSVPIVRGAEDIHSGCPRKLDEIRGIVGAVRVRFFIVIPVVPIRITLGAAEFAHRIRNDY